MTVGFPGDRPDGAALLAEARRVLLEMLLPLLPADRRLDALMIANAMGIAGRELEGADRAPREALARLCALYGETPPAPPDGGLRDSLAALERRLAADLRAGAFDSGAKRDALRAHLRATTAARLTVSNPKLLK